MSAPVATRLEEQAWAISVELTEARKRGLDELDDETGRKHRVPLPELEQLARRYTGDNQSNRIGLIRRLLTDALDAWAAVDQGRHADDAAFVRALFIAKPGAAPGDRRATKLLHDVMSARNLTEDRLDDRRRATFRLFARFLVGFVDDRADAAPDSWGRQHATQLIVALAMLVLVGVLVLAWAPWTGDSAPSTPSGQTSGGALFTFDALGGASPIINVYPGVSDSPADKIASGTFSSGQTAPAICKTTGRTVTSDVNAGEEQRESDAWIEVIEQAGVTHYASLTYGTMDQGGLELLPACDP
jgi:hypothetical protein